MVARIYIVCEVRSAWR
uniref:Uncharacterized protein n=1 Tax=Anguilla anguilla TaxID=7936 RepID=A0A0E9QGQ8_ANGAN